MAVQVLAPLITAVTAGGSELPALTVGWGAILSQNCVKALLPEGV
eukprot:COSAG01_NODE_508_length_16107_cov_120.001187_23_plen_45_part_00